MVKSGAFAGINGSCTEQECFYNITENIFQNIGLSESAIYFKYPGEMLTPWKINQYFFFIVFTYIVAFIVGVIGNIMVITVLLGDRKSRNVTSVFLVSLAIADLLILMICAPLDVAHYFVIQWDSEGTVCKLAAYAESVSAFASVLNLLAVTVERFVVIVYPIRSRSLCTMTNCKRVVGAVWTTSLVLALPVVFSKGIVKATFTNYYEYVTIFSCKDSSDGRGFAIAVYRFITLFALPSLLMITCYTWVIIELWMSTRTMEEMTNTENRERHATAAKGLHRSNSRGSISGDNKIHDSTERYNAQGPVKAARQQVIKMLILVVLLFLICWGPRLMMEIVLKCCLNVFNHYVYTTRFIFYLLPFVHSCLNPIVYCFMSSKFRKRLCRCCRRKENRPVPKPIPLRRSASKNGPSRPGSTYTFASCVSPTNEVVPPGSSKQTTEK